ncbi:uncharacterized protein HRG_06220 [Hirsutella rhossiliensis]|uniref:Uncharacterized protein n=1 Tax=Hirsutella rhossiliensis TaxID=111463 RepID=A0A9P8SJH1_9HYPO|nr:uncharacterized protein HRG_06220 [Hirsutella rhossiliensis]KAH0963710.1 hypothetical protein HRG_06220 [Hirsutella rhossiliensis]
MDVDFYWGTNGDGTEDTKSVGLTDPHPLMIKSRHAAADAYVFMASGGRCYLWNMATGDVFQYVKPADSIASWPDEEAWGKGAGGDSVAGAGFLGGSWFDEG